LNLPDLPACGLSAKAAPALATTIIAAVTVATKTLARLLFIFSPPFPFRQSKTDHLFVGR
jgi:hypothetical protein